MKPNVRPVLDIVKLVGKGFGTMKGFAVYTLHTVLGLPKYKKLPVGSKLKPVTLPFVDTLPGIGTFIGRPIFELNT
jgi:hypothetical protein